MTTRATITLSSAQVIGGVQNHLYGANLEHFGQSVYGGHWAEMLQDRKFSGQDQMYIGLQEGLRHEYVGFGVVRPWIPINPNNKHVRFVHDNTIFFSGRQSQRITVERDDGESHGIEQRNLYLEKTRTYQIRLVLRGTVDVVTVSLGDQTWSIKNGSDTWTTYETNLIPENTNSDGALSIAFVGIGTLWIGAASVMPADNIKGHRQDVIDAILDWSPTFLRWPGGNFVSAYHWQDGIGCRDKRSTRLDPAFSLLEPNDVGTDEFIDLCRLLKAEPILTVNMGTGTPEEAAAWVEYCNGDDGTKHGRLRAINGYEEPHNVKTWFVGNELFGNWQVGHVDPETYARLYLDFARAMKRADADLRLIAVGVPIDLYGRWNEFVLKQCREEMDQLSLHYYSIRTEWMESPPIGGDIYMAKLACSYEVEQMLDETLDIIDKATGSNTLPIAFDEWNTYVDAKEPGFIGTYDLADGIYVGGMMNAFIRRCDRIHLSCIYNLINAMAPYRVTPTYRWKAQLNGGPEGTYWLGTAENPDAAPMTWKMPQALVLELMTQHRGRVGISCIVDGPTFSTQATGTLPAYALVPLIDAAATHNPENGRSYVSLVNRALGDSVEITIEGVDRTEDTTIYLVSGDTPGVTNTADVPEAVVIKKTVWSVESPRFTVPPHSFAMVLL